MLFTKPKDKVKMLKSDIKYFIMKIVEILKMQSRFTLRKHCNKTNTENIRMVRIGEEKFSRDDMKNKLEEFSELYKNRPVKNNTYGMKSPHLFLSWFVMQTLKPEYIIESGVYKGQGTWVFEKACPLAKIHSIDIALWKRQYISNRAVYHNKDFANIDWSDVQKDKTICFFDDHQNAVERVRFLESSGFKKVIFEDNFPSGQGDCYSLKQAFDRGGQDAVYLSNVIKIYNELPPVFKTDKTLWGDMWSKERYPTPEPLYKNVEKEYLRIFLDEAVHYYWMCYVELK